MPSRGGADSGRNQATAKPLEDCKRAAAGRPRTASHSHLMNYATTTNTLTEKMPQHPPFHRQADSIVEYESHMSTAEGRLQGT